ncbi:hypothetical protein L486_03441 [Kwoniella mangroviensis CBS 10435]|uniref:Uncharacterized protein n=1 Tax=Kwoniella mangroviensis CBS 10435 TaxID=1331196 RepID=A0A1B9ITT4_9TREE|nr:hypothetical protein L486_03441 [Kwoniella mangroviensis CBS 10435]
MDRQAGGEPVLGRPLTITIVPTTGRTRTQQHPENTEGPVTHSSWADPNLTTAYDPSHPQDHRSYVRHYPFTQLDQPTITAMPSTYQHVDQHQPIRFHLLQHLLWSSRPIRTRREIERMIMVDRIEASTIHRALLNMYRNPLSSHRVRRKVRIDLNVSALAVTRDDKRIQVPVLGTTMNGDGVRQLVVDEANPNEHHGYLFSRPQDPKDSEDEHLSFAQIAKMGAILLRNIVTILKKPMDDNIRTLLHALWHGLNHFVHLVLNNRMVMFEDDLFMFLRQIDPILASALHPFQVEGPLDGSSSTQPWSSHQHPIDITSSLNTAEQSILPFPDQGQPDTLSRPAVHSPQNDIPKSVNNALHVGPISHVAVQEASSRLRGSVGREEEAVSDLLSLADPSNGHSRTATQPSTTPSGRDHHPMPRPSPYRYWKIREEPHAIEVANIPSSTETLIRQTPGDYSRYTKTPYLTPSKRHADTYTEKVIDGVTKRLKIMERKEGVDR